MPIYEFRCLKCNECFEMLFTHTQEAVELKCEKCGSRDVERIMSGSNFAVSAGSCDARAVTQTRNCASGSCTTYDIPGPR